MSQIGSAEECWETLLGQHAAASSIAELLCRVLDDSGRDMHAEIRPSVVDAALRVGDVSRLVDLLVEHRDVMVNAVRGCGERLPS